MEVVKRVRGDVGDFMDGRVGDEEGVAGERELGEEGELFERVHGGVAFNI